jgi:DNA-binding transcriptional regulator GbsR (MarR family)
MTKAYYKVQKDLIREVGCEAAILFAHLENLSISYFGGKEFYQQQHRICADLNLSKHKVIAATKKLIEAKLIKVIEESGKKHKYKILTGKEIEPEAVKNLNRSGKEIEPLAVKILNCEDEANIDEDLIEESTDEKQKDPSETVTHERTSEELKQERMDVFLKGEMFDNSIFEETKQKSVIEETKEKKTVTDLSAAMLQFIHEFDY